MCTYSFLACYFVMSVNCDLSDVVDNHAISTQKLHAGRKLRMGIKCADQLPYDGDRKGEWRTCECRVTSLIPCLQKISSTRRCVHELWMWMLNVNTNGQMLLNWDATCSKDMRSYPSFISFTFHYSAFVLHDSFPYLSVVVMWQFTFLLLYHHCIYCFGAGVLS